MSEENKPCSVYRYFSRRNELLYVGVSHNPFVRESKRHVQPEMTEVAFIELEWFENGRTAMAAEEIAIEREKPLWNVRGNDPVRSLACTPWTELELRVHDKKYDDLGRPPKWPIATPEQAAAIVGIWHSPAKRSEVIKRVRKMMGVSVPDYWVRDQVIKAKGNARRSED